jgi:hypothetical protein
VAYDRAKGEDKWKIGMLTEALMVAAETQQDFDPFCLGASPAL